MKMKTLLIFIIVSVLSIFSLKIQPSLYKSLKLDGKVNIFVSFQEGTLKLLYSIEKQRFANRMHKISTITDILILNSNKSQSRVQAYLNAHNIPYNSFWITNQIHIKNSNVSLMEYLAESFPEISEIIPEIGFPMDPPPVAATVKVKSDYAWGIDKIQARDVWEMEDGSDGAGIIVGGIDSGVRYTHEALADNFVGEYGWFDPFDKIEVPFDDTGHGTHTIGTVVGKNGIGVAPGAKWMACRGCNFKSCNDPQLLACGQFMLCPTLANGTKRNCSKAPHIVINSWGGPGGDRFFGLVINAWVLAGIVPIFSNGNAGSRCRTSSSPGDHRLAISVGNTDIDDSLYEKSSRGPAAATGIIKPNLCAPGTKVLSASNVTDTSYVEDTGTSFAAPHVAGVAALLLSHSPNLSVSDIKYYLTYGNEQSGLMKPGQNCGNVSEDTFPNNAFGSGRISAFTSFDKLLEDTNKTTSGEY